MDKEIVSLNLRVLAASRRKLKASFEWLALKRMEHRLGEPPVLTMNPEIATDIRYEQGILWHTATDVLEALNRGEPKGASEGKRREWRQEVLRMKAEMESLALPKAF